MVFNVFFYKSEKNMFLCFFNLQSNVFNIYQWRRQTIKTGSAFKDQLYFQLGQMEGPKVPSEAREARSAKGVWGGAP